MIRWEAEMRHQPVPPLAGTSEKPSGTNTRLRKLVVPLQEQRHPHRLPMRLVLLDELVLVRPERGQEEQRPIRCGTGPFNPSRTSQKALENDCSHSLQPTRKSS